MTRARCVLRRRENFYKSLYYVYHSLSIGAFNKPHAQTYRFRFSPFPRHHRLLTLAVCGAVPPLP